MFKIIGEVGQSAFFLGLYISPIIATFYVIHYFVNEESNNKITCSNKSTSKSKTWTYEETGRIKLQKLFEDPEYKIKYNSNINTIFYNVDELEKELSLIENTLEKEWSTRIIIEHTPSGNVSMYYDPYKQAFTYTCDKQVSYNVLNTVAIEYVIHFCCLDFFIDTNVLPAHYKSPLTIVLEQEEQKQQKKKKEKRKNMGINFDHSLFLKPKNQNSIISTLKTELTTEPVYKNTFRFVRDDLLTTPKESKPELSMSEILCAIKVKRRKLSSFHSSTE